MRIINIISACCTQLLLIILVSVIPTSMAESLDFENCQGFLSDTEIKNTIDYDGDLEIKLSQ